MGTEKLFRVLAQTIGSYHRCEGSETHADWRDKHKVRARALVLEHFPHGSGFDSGTTLDLDASTEEKLVFTTAFHHMHESGMYDGWTDHTVTVRPSLAFGFRLSVSGRDRNDIKDYIAEAFDCALNLDVDDGRVNYATQAPSPQTV
jgi:hypothetical protein